MRCISSEIKSEIKIAAYELGFDLCRILRVGKAPHGSFFVKWLERGNAATMHYLEHNVEKRLNPAKLANIGQEFKSMIVLAVDYYQASFLEAALSDPSRGRISRYAWGLDYHELIKPLLYELDAIVRSKTGRKEHAKCLVDTGPVLERDGAHRSGIGFTGKNCCTINPKLGSWLFLATLLIPEEVDSDPIVTTDDGTVSAKSVLGGLQPKFHAPVWSFPGETSKPTVREKFGTCGRCDRCLVACPTEAFVGPFHLDSRRCISYWTIETQEAIPRELRPRFRNWIFGCDVCQDVCPWNKGQAAREPRIAGLRANLERVAPPLLEGFDPARPYWLHQETFSQFFSKSPVRRAKRTGMLRNVCVALGNWGDVRALSALKQALDDESDVVREHATWALVQVYRRTNIAEGRALLEKLARDDRSPRVRDEAHAAL
jgi:epoxyqueuosine reductase